MQGIFFLLRLTSQLHSSVVLTEKTKANVADPRGRNSGDEDCGEVDSGARCRRIALSEGECESAVGFGKWVLVLKDAERCSCGCAFVENDYRYIMRQARHMWAGPRNTVE